MLSYCSSEGTGGSAQLCTTALQAPQAVFRTVDHSIAVFKVKKV